VTCTDCRTKQDQCECRRPKHLWSDVAPCGCDIRHTKPSLLIRRLQAPRRSASSH
jgi:hypothetical protein